MKKVHNAENHESALEELFKRYEERGAAYDKSPECAEQQTREILMRANARKTYKATRDYTPKSNVNLDTVVLLQRMDQARYGKKNNMKSNSGKNDVKTKLQAQADKSNPKAERKQAPSKKGNSQEGKLGKASTKIKEVAKEAAKTWVPLEERKEEKIVQGGKTKIPGTLILAIIVITVSLLLIVGSAVLLASARSEQNELEDKISLLDKEIAELRTDLDRKNADADIEVFAKEELGMISQEHVNFEYIKSDKTDGVTKQQNEKVSFSSLINWIFHQFK